MLWGVYGPRWWAVLREKVRREPLAKGQRALLLWSADWQLRRRECIVVENARWSSSCSWRLPKIWSKCAKHAKLGTCFTDLTSTTTLVQFHQIISGI